MTDSEKLSLALQILSLPSPVSADISELQAIAIGYLTDLMKAEAK